MTWKDKIAMKIAYALPRQLVYWCAIRLMSHATTGQWGNQSPTDLLAMDALQRWVVPYAPFISNSYSGSLPNQVVNQSNQGYR